MEQTRWFDRKFDFGKEENIFPSLLERLMGTPVRLEAKIREIPPEFLGQRIGDKWSIKENIGHLTDLEPLWQGRLEDIQNGLPEMRPADLENRKTTQAGHNQTAIETLLQNFRQCRQETLQSLMGIDEAMVFKSSLHPRLKTPMRTMDLFLFVAEHDDHHLACISAITKILLDNDSTMNSHK